MNQIHSENISHVRVDVNLMVGNVIRNKTGTIIGGQYQCKKPITHRACKKDCAWSPSKHTCERDKDCEMGEYQKKCTCMKCLVHDLAITCDEIEDIRESALVNPSNRIKY